jgi:23S rRNA (uracil1939-C5)-methyltransferase
MLNAIIAAAKASPGLKPVTSEVRDLFRVPLSPPELGRFDAVVLDPPRAGAEAQSRALAASKVRQIVYVSCNADSFARDAAILAAGGFSRGPVTPVDQFLWSSHIELVASFTRSGR